MSIKNAGQTPASKLVIRTGQMTAKVEPNVGDIKIREQPEYEIPLGPGQSSEHILLNEDFAPLCAKVSYADFINGRGPNIYIAGIIKYADIYGVARITKFHFGYGSTDVTNGNVTFCRQGNDAT